jgi:hypothetical protein
MNQIVRDLAFHISPQGYHEPNSRDLAFHISYQEYYEPNSP